jgi:iron complex transport system substrate-binding protein
MKALKYITTLVFCAILVVGCGETNQLPQDIQGDTTSFPLIVTDSLDREVEISKEPRRIVSLAPAATEILFSLDLGDRIVGVTEYCDYPPEARGMEKIGDFLTPSVEKVLSVEPDLILATGGIQLETVNQLEGLGKTVIVLDPQNLEEIIKTIELVGTVTNHRAEASRVTAEMRGRLQEITAKTSGLPQDKRIDTFIIVWIEGANIYTVGPNTFIFHLVELAGGRNIAQDAAGEYFQYSLEKLLEQDPDVIISIVHGYHSPEEVKAVLGFNRLKAVKNNRIYVIPDADLLTLPGPRIVDGLEMVVDFLHPDLFALK